MKRLIFTLLFSIAMISQTSHLAAMQEKRKGDAAHDDSFAKRRRTNRKEEKEDNDRKVQFDDNPQVASLDDDEDAEKEKKIITATITGKNDNISISFPISLLASSKTIHPSTASELMHDSSKKSSEKNRIETTCKGLFNNVQEIMLFINALTCIEQNNTLSKITAALTKVFSPDNSTAIKSAFRLLEISDFLDIPQLTQGLTSFLVACKARSHLDNKETKLSNRELINNLYTPLLEQTIYEQITQPDFDFIIWYLQLPEGRDEKSVRQRVLNQLSKKTEDLVNDKDEKEIKAFFESLSEGWFKMQVRHYYLRIKKTKIDDVPIDIIMEKVNAENGNICLSNRRLALLINGISDLLIVRNGIRQILSIDLSENQLTGSIPTELGNLPMLQLLYLNSNQLTGSVPRELGNLLMLQELDLSENQLTGSIPTELDNVFMLKVLYFSNNQLTGSIPAALKAKFSKYSFIDNRYRNEGNKFDN